MAVSAQFEEVITTHLRLRELSNQPSQRASNKIIDHIDDICRRFIAASPFVVISSRGADGTMDLSPKGDPPGFVKRSQRKHDPEGESEPRAPLRCPILQLCRELFVCSAEDAIVCHQKRKHSANVRCSKNGREVC